MSELNYIVGVGAGNDELPILNLIEADNFCKNFDRPAFILTQDESIYGLKPKDRNGCKLVSYKLLSNITAPVTVIIDKRNNDFLDCLEHFLKTNNNAFLIVDLIAPTYDLIDKILSFIEQYRVANNIHVLINFESIVVLDYALVNPNLNYTCFKFQGIKRSVINLAVEQDLTEMIGHLGELDGLGFMISHLLVAEYQNQYNDFCKSENRTIDKKVLLNPIYYSKSSISLTKPVFDNLINLVLDKLPFVEHTVEDIKEMYRVYD